MKHFACGDVVPGCDQTFAGEEDEILTAVAAHAARDHGLDHLSPSVVDEVRSRMVSVA